MGLINLGFLKFVCLSALVVNAVCQTEYSVVDWNCTTVSSELKDLQRQLKKLQDTVSALVGSSDVSSALLPKDCSEALTRGVRESGVYMVKPLDCGRPFHVYCDMDTDGGGWTVFQWRKDGSVDFYLNFADYSRGFGSFDGEFWLGNEFLHRLTAEGVHELRVDLSDFYGNTRYAKYGLFRIGDISDNYRLTVRSYSGSAGDSMAYHNGNQFSAKDLDNDPYTTKNCAQFRRGAWWYRSCVHSNLNGPYLHGTITEGGRGVVWFHWKGYEYSLKTTEMKIRSTP